MFDLTSAKGLPDKKEKYFIASNHNSMPQNRIQNQQFQTAKNANNTKYNLYENILAAPGSLLVESENND
jgi:hypothetical protein